MQSEYWPNTSKDIDLHELYKDIIYIKNAASALNLILLSLCKKHRPGKNSS
jgi:hypothetical protein